MQGNEEGREGERERATESDGENEGASERGREKGAKEEGRKGARWREGGKEGWMDGGREREGGVPMLPIHFEVQFRPPLHSALSAIERATRRKKGGQKVFQI